MAALNTVKTGQIAGSTTAVQFPVVACNLIKFKALAGNGGKVYIGNSTITRPKGGTNTTTGFELSAGEETGWLPVSDMSNFYLISDLEADKLVYLALL